jgi:hypothetical protein
MPMFQGLCHPRFLLTKVCLMGLFDLNQLWPQHVTPVVCQMWLTVTHPAHLSCCVWADEQAQWRHAVANLRQASYAAWRHCALQLPGLHSQT